MPGKVNPVDCASRGIYADEFKEHSLWWHGPPMMKLHEDFGKKYGNNEFVTKKELNSVVLFATATKSIIPNASSFFKLRKIFAYVLRFVSNCKFKQRKVNGLTISELRKAETVIIKLLHEEHFAPFNFKSNDLRKLNIFVDHDGILRVGGRSKNANIPFDQRHQMLIPNKSDVTDLIAKYIYSAYIVDQN